MVKPKPKKLKGPKVVKAFTYQRGTSNRQVDALIKKALKPGKRESKTGKTYWESRKNRSDLTATGL